MRQELDQINKSIENLKNRIISFLTISLTFASFLVAFGTYIQSHSGIEFTFEIKVFIWIIILISLFICLNNFFIYPKLLSKSKILRLDIKNIYESQMSYKNTLISTIRQNFLILIRSRIHLRKLEYRLDSIQLNVLTIVGIIPILIILIISFLAIENNWAIVYPIVALILNLVILILYRWKYKKEHTQDINKLTEEEKKIKEEYSFGIK